MATPHEFISISMNEHDRSITGVEPLAQPVPDDLDAWKEKLFDHVARREKDALGAVQPALNAHPTDPELLLLAALAALLDERPDQSLRYQHRFAKRFRPFAAEDHLLRTIALAQQERWPQAAQIVKQHGYSRLHSSLQYLPCGWPLMGWVRGWLGKIERREKRLTVAQDAPPKAKARPTGKNNGARPAPATKAAAVTVPMPTEDESVAVEAPLCHVSSSTFQSRSACRSSLTTLSNRAATATT